MNNGDGQPQKHIRQVGMNLGFTISAANVVINYGVESEMISD